MMMLSAAAVAAVAVAVGGGFFAEDGGGVVVEATTAIFSGLGLRETVAAQNGEKKSGSLTHSLGLLLLRLPLPLVGGGGRGGGPLHGGGRQVGRGGGVGRAAGRQRVCRDGRRGRGAFFLCFSVLRILILFLRGIEGGRVGEGNS